MGYECESQENRSRLQHAGRHDRYAPAHGRATTDQLNIKDNVDFRRVSMLRLRMINEIRNQQHHHKHMHQQVVIVVGGELMVTRGCGR